MKIENIIKKTLDKISLTIVETEILFREIMDGKISDEVLKKFYSVYQIKVKVLKKLLVELKF